MQYTPMRDYTAVFLDVSPCRLGSFRCQVSPRAFRLSGVHVIELTADIPGARSSSAPKQARDDASPAVATAEAGAGVWACLGFVSLFCERSAGHVGFDGTNAARPPASHGKGIESRWHYDLRYEGSGRSVMGRLSRRSAVRFGGGFGWGASVTALARSGPA